MSKYEIQFQIFKTMQEIYPNCQIQEVEDYIQKLWNKDAITLEKLLKKWKDIANA